MSKPRDSFYEQSGVIPFMRLQEELHLVLITSSSKRQRWIVPKGMVEKNLTPAESATKEAWEEAGIVGYTYPHVVGEYQYPKWGGICRVQLFLLEVEQLLTTWEEDKIRSRRLVTPTEAYHLLDVPAVKNIVLQLPSLLSSMISP
ncbi:NUDIX hydrolase [Beggiatoa leptomitoformis]|uniref:NUDIX domain-containing protein n=1 Tax=Beggiatoa leptomitoformis TaxID=288004 RepID=A0A650GE13_9GAMM|nr:NUDIX hydrolase [Beggiatoa leptomitoformis]ALG68757.1 NUDIX domain-containing protein [Beggiatoa leptomitoformis]QGX04128.1 NUDIX domain-containing protein [Beggiatoa leptomitoformis]